MSSHTAEKIVATATQIVHESGPDTITMRLLGSRLGLSRSAMYRHFDDKESLLAEIARRGFATLHRELWLPGDQATIQILRERAIRFVQFGRAKPWLYELMFIRAWDKDRFPRLYQEARSVFDATSDLHERLTVELPHTIADPLRKSAVLFAFLHGLVVLNNSSHTEPEKGLDDPGALISLFLKDSYGVT